MRELFGHLQQDVKTDCLVQALKEQNQVQQHIVSLIETAKANKLDPYKYLTYIFTYLPGQDINDPDILNIFMPWDDEVQNRCKL